MSLFKTTSCLAVGPKAHPLPSAFRPRALRLPLQDWLRSSAGLLMLSALLGTQALAAGLAPVELGSAAHFTILAGAAITTTGGGIINGDVGAYPINGASIHLTQAQVNGTIYASDASGPPGSVIAPSLLLAAKGDLTTAYNDAAGRQPIPVGPFLNPGDGNIGGMQLACGLYKFPGVASITGSDVTLSGGPNDVWIFQVGAELNVGSGIQVILAGGAQARNIFWQVGTSATIETFAVFNGTILADQAITMKTSSTMNGRALAFTAGVTYNGTGGTIPTPATPIFTDISRAPSGAVTLVLDTTPFFELILQTSTELSAGWVTINSATPTTRVYTYPHPASDATGPRRFYRAFIKSP